MRGGAEPRPQSRCRCRSGRPQPGPTLPCPAPPALPHAHAAWRLPCWLSGVTHFFFFCSDLKAENLMLDENLNLKIVDFGLSNACEKGSFLQVNGWARGSVPSSPRRLSCSRRNAGRPRTRRPSAWAGRSMGRKSTSGALASTCAAALLSVLGGWSCLWADADTRSPRPPPHYLEGMRF